MTLILDVLIGIVVTAGSVSLAVWGVWFWQICTRRWPVRDSGSTNAEVAEYGEVLRGEVLLVGGAEVPIVAVPPVKFTVGRHRAKPSAALSRALFTPTGPVPIVTSTGDYGQPALTAPPPVVPRWSRWVTPPGGVPVLTGSGVAT